MLCNIQKRPFPETLNVCDAFDYLYGRKQSLKNNIIIVLFVLYNIGSKKVQASG